MWEIIFCYVLFGNEISLAICLSCWLSWHKYIIMLGCLFLGFLILLLIVSVIATDNEFSNCNCDEEGIWSIHTILECQKVSAFLIAIAYFSIPLELLYFISCSDVPFKWVLVQFIAFIVLCGLTHLLNGWTYSGHRSFQLIMSLTIMKILNRSCVVCNCNHPLDFVSYAT